LPFPFAPFQRAQIDAARTVAVSNEIAVSNPRERNRKIRKRKSRTSDSRFTIHKTARISATIKTHSEVVICNAFQRDESGRVSSAKAVSGVPGLRAMIAGR
jgi:hypothetical protein